MLSSLKLLVRDLLMKFRMMMEMRQMPSKRSNFFYLVDVFECFLFRKICLYKIEDDSINLIAEDSLKQEMLETDVRINHKNQL